MGYVRSDMQKRVEDLRQQSFSLLGSGYVELVDAWGSEEGIIEAARMSTQKGFRGWEPRTVYDCRVCGKKGIEVEETYEGEGGGRGHRGKGPRACWGAVEPRETSDEKLLAFLWKNKHETPFEMAGFTVEVQAPIFVFREWHRHRVPFGYNEMSSRYEPLPDENYMPTVARLMQGVGEGNKQSARVDGAPELTQEKAEAFQEQLLNLYRGAQDLYDWALRVGVPKELARVHLPVGRFSRMRATSNLRGWLNFLRLRQAPNAQYEIRVYADVVADCIVKELFPRTRALFAEHR